MRRFALFAFFIVILSQSGYAALAASGDTVKGGDTGSITITQVGPVEDPDVLGQWTLIQPGNKVFDANAIMFGFGASEIGNYTFTAESPSGATGSIEFHRNGVLEKSIPRPQISFALGAGDEVDIVITYTYTRTGTVSVTSIPKGLSFTLKGPNDAEYKSKTPESFLDAPEGQYAAYFDPIEDCITPKPISGRLIKGGRVNLTIEVACDALGEVAEQKEEEKSLEHVTVTTEDRDIIYYDVPIGMWFAPYVHLVAKTGVMSGYSDGAGNPLGKFGPENNVTVAELSKIAHKISGIDETKILVSVENVRAKSTWFEQFFASAEQRWWEVYRDRRIDPGRPATRTEVVVTLLRALNVPRTWAEGKTFEDVLPTMEFADAIETAAADGLVDSGGMFRPGDPINRAELAKILAKATEIYIENTQEIRGGSR